MTTGLSDIDLAAEGGRAAPLSTRRRAAPSLGWLRREAAAQLDRWWLWAPVAFGCGCGLYFLLPREPALTAGFGMLLAALTMAVAAQRWSPSRSLAVGVLLLALGVAGVGAAKLREAAVSAPVMPVGAPAISIEAFVVDVANPGQGGQRLLLAPIRVGDLPPEATPIRARVTLREGSVPPAPGSAVRVLGMLNPPPPPASPGAYDFARDAYFESVGAVGFALGEVERLDLAPEPPRRLALQMRVNAVRWALAERIVQVLGVERGGLAAAMTTGHEAFVPREQMEALRASGLAHIVSISGLHMAIVGGFAFAAARLAVAAFPWAALRLPGKKLAAVAGLMAVGGYLALSGAPSPAERAAITAGAAFVAILADRRALSLHTLALAALAILILQPEAVTEPGFQMSFAATTALVALAELWPRPAREISVPWPIRAAQAVAAWSAASIGASFVAGLATGPIAMQHFNRVSTFGLAANLLAAPISSFLLMPALAVGAVLAPLGLGEAPLWAAGVAIQAVVGIAAWVAGFPNAQLVVASAPGWTLPAAFLGILWICLWRGRLRWLGLPLALSVVLWPRPVAPDAWVAADGAAVAIRRGEAAVLFRPDVKLFGAELWSRRRGLLLAEDGAALRDAAYECERWTCAPRRGSPSVAAVWTRRGSTVEKAMPALCAAEVVVVRGAAPAGACPGSLVLDREDFARGGSVELYRQPGGWRAVWAQDLRGQRPWSAFSGNGG